MIISLLIVLLVMFSVFMFSIKGLDESAKNVSIGVSIVGVIFILFKVIGG